MKKVDKLLKGMLGEEGFVTLRKHIFRQDSQTTLTPIDMYLPLLAVPRTVLSWLVQNVNSIPLGEEKIIRDVPSLGNIDMHLKRTGNDSYSAEFVRDGQILHQFDNQTLPMLGGQIIAFSGDYSGAVGGEVAQQVVSAVDDTAELRNLVRAMGKLIDHLVSEKIATKEEPIAKKAYDPNTAKQGPSGFPLPNGPSGPGEPAKPAKKPQIKINQQAKAKQDFKQKDMAKSELATDKAKYFGGKLEFIKKSSQYFVTEANLYTKCRQCGIANFKKTETGPSLSPCACFEDSFTSGPFISNLAKSVGGYKIQFSKDADEESVGAFVLTLLNKVK